MNATQEKAVGDWHRATAQETAHAESTKIGRVLATLRSGRSLNRCYAIIDRWEEVPTRFGKRARVKRYSYAGVRHA